MMGQVTHLAAPGREATLPPCLLHLRHPPFHGAEWLEIFLWLSSPAETTKLLQNQNNEEKSVFHLGAELRLRMLSLKGLSALRCNTAFINYQLFPD